MVQSICNYFINAANIFIVDQRYKYILKGLLFSLEVTLLAGLIGIVVGIIIALLRLSDDFLRETRFANLTKYNIFSKFAVLYIDVIRGTPAVVQLMFVNVVIFVGPLKDASKLLMAGIAFGFNSGAYVAEILRSGIVGLDRGQMEASRALGMPYRLSMQKIILPQAIKNTLPTLVNEFIILLKETSVVGFIGGVDLLRSANIITSITYRGVEPLILVAIIYLTLTSIFTFIMRKVERRMRISD